MSDLTKTLLLSRLDAEAGNIATKYRLSDVTDVKFDDEAGTWLYVSRFPTAPGWNMAEVEILLVVPLGYPAVAPEHFWTDKRLRTYEGRTVAHFFGEGTSENPEYLRKGWAKFCIHIRSWIPSSGKNLKAGDSLLTMLELISVVFNQQKQLFK